MKFDPVPGVNFMKTRWPSDPLKARFIALGFSTEEAGVFSNQFNETFRAAGHIFKGKHLSNVALACEVNVQRPGFLHTSGCFGADGMARTLRPRCS